MVGWPHTMSDVLTMTPMLKFTAGTYQKIRWAHLELPSQVLLLRWETTCPVFVFQGTKVEWIWWIPRFLQQMGMPQGIHSFHIFSSIYFRGTAISSESQVNNSISRFPAAWCRDGPWWSGTFVAVCDSQLPCLGSSRGLDIKDQSLSFTVTKM